MSRADRDDWHGWTLPTLKEVSVALAIIVPMGALFYLASGYPAHQAEAFYKVGEALLVALALLWSLRQPRGEVGAPPAEEPKGTRHSWWTVAFLLGFAAFAWFDPLARLEPIVGFSLLPALFLALLLGGGVALLRKARAERADGFEEGAAEAQKGAAMCFALAAALLVFWGLSFVHFA